MTTRVQMGLLMASLGLALLATACSSGMAAAPTRPAINAANVVATATVKAGGTPGGSAPVPSGPGAQLFQTNCVACHQVGGQGGIIGPDLSKIGADGGAREPGKDAAAYIRESIVQPNAYIVSGYQANVMPQNFGEILTPEQLDQVVNYLLEQK